MTEGRVLGLVGESGSGKSTIARAVLGLALIFQDPFGSLNPRMPVAEIIAEGLEARGDLRPAGRAAEVTRPAVLIADEITSALDVSVQAQVLNVLRGILATQRLSMLFISHNLAVVRYISDDLAVMRDGVIVEAGPVDEVLAAPRHPYTRELLDAIPHLHAPAIRDN